LGSLSPRGRMSMSHLNQVCPSDRNTAGRQSTLENTTSSERLADVYQPFGVAGECVRACEVPRCGHHRAKGERFQETVHFVALRNSSSRAIIEALSAGSMLRMRSRSSSRLSISSCAFILNSSRSPGSSHVAWQAG